MKFFGDGYEMPEVTKFHSVRHQKSLTDAQGAAQTEARRSSLKSDDTSLPL